ncbi:hypothetical protein Nepgr_023145 [Nepenthes gracilis]|uniref:Uncharacterized protein n=1 Tax=Nepenthes gracilis TaxID=150966 RepID=A0AAD3T068_NEPGR|nr:hypothetical protein Nepgr_023145 [Nepenthes gracilis]
MCVEVGRGDPLPPKIWLLTGAAEPALTVEVEIIYHSKPARISSGILNNHKHVANKLPMARASGVERMCAATCLPMALVPGNEEGGSHFAHLASPVGVKPPVSVSGLLDGLGVGLTDAVLGPKEAPTVDVGGSTGPIKFSDGAHHVLDSSSCSLDQFDGSLVEVPSINVNDSSRARISPLCLMIWLSNRNLVTWLPLTMGWNDLHVAAASAVPPADTIIGAEMCLDYGQLLMDSVCLKNLSGFATVGQWLRGVFCCCAAVRQFVADRDVVDCRRGGIVQGSSDAVRKLA